MLLTYSIGDIHGALHKLQMLLLRCEAHAGGRPRRYVFLGDAIDRGPDSAGVVRALRQMPDAVMLTGNHEAMLLAARDGAIAPALWLEQGGDMTLQSYGVQEVGQIPQDHVDWLRGLPRRHDDGRRLFVHAGIDPRRPLEAQDENDLIWIREPFLAATQDYGRLIVHGHTPCLSGKPDVRTNRVNLDTGAGYGGPLTAAVFTDDATPPVDFLQAE